VAGFGYLALIALAAVGVALGAVRDVRDEPYAAFGLLAGSALLLWGCAIAGAFSIGLAVAPSAVLATVATIAGATASRVESASFRRDRAPGFRRSGAVL
jgi:hypothetical protein